MHQLKHRPNILDCFWRFARGDMEASEFENWLYSNEGTQLALGEDPYLNAISVDYRDGQRVADFRAELRKSLPHPADCECHTISDWGLVILGQWSPDNFEVVQRETSSPYWLHSLVCKECQTRWTVAEDSRIYDVWIVVRVASFDMAKVNSYSGLLSLAVSSGAMVRYDDPIHSIELPAAIEELAREKPGISLTELTGLLPVDREIVDHHARDVIAKSRVSIDLET